MQNINVSFEPTIEQSNEIKEWLIEEEKKVRLSGFFCNWNSIQSSFDDRKMAIILANGEVLGFITWFDMERVTKIQIAEIKPGFRKMGLGKILTNALLSHLKNQGVIAVKLHCQPSEAENAWKKIGFKNFPNVPEMEPFNNYEEGRHLYQILRTYANPNKKKSSNEVIELWAVEPHLSQKHSPEWVWDLKFENGSRKLAAPIIAPAKYKWNICWKIDGEIIKTGQIKYFSKTEIHFDSFLFIEELPLN